MTMFPLPSFVRRHPRSFAISPIVRFDTVEISGEQSTMSPTLSRPETPKDREFESYFGFVSSTYPMITWSEPSRSLHSSPGLIRKGFCSCAHFDVTESVNPPDRDFIDRLIDTSSHPKCCFPLMRRVTSSATIQNLQIDSALDESRMLNFISVDYVLLEILRTVELIGEHDRRNGNVRSYGRHRGEILSRLRDGLRDRSPKNLERGVDVIRNARLHELIDLGSQLVASGDRVICGRIGHVCSGRRSTRYRDHLGQRIHLHLILRLNGSAHRSRGNGRVRVSKSKHLLCGSENVRRIRCRF